VEPQLKKEFMRMTILRLVLAALVMGGICNLPAFAQTSPLNLDQATRASSAKPAQLAFNGGPPNFFEILFGGLRPPMAQHYQNDPSSAPDRSALARLEQEAVETDQPARRPLDPKFLPQTVAYSGPEKPGTVIIDTPNRLLFLVQEDGRALRYGIGVGRAGFTWSGVKQVSAKREWPDWIPPEDMLARRPDLPHFMAGGPENPLGARAMYLGSSIYRIHGSNEPWSIGTAVSSGCIRMRNQDVIDLYERVKIGTRVVVI
jgi:lipoprotein-anchoring transpeptidase ErfK/SrfK